MDWIGWAVVLVVCAVVAGLVRDGRRRRVAGRDDAAVAGHRAAADADHRRHTREAAEFDQRHAGYGGGGTT